MEDKLLRNVNWFIYLILTILVGWLFMWSAYSNVFGIIFLGHTIEESTLSQNDTFMISFNFFMVLSVFGLTMLMFICLGIIESIFKPKTNKELILRKKQKEMNKKYPDAIAYFKKKELRYLFKLEKIRDKLKEFEKK